MDYIMFCKNCGVEIAEGSLICGNCGTPVEEPAVEAPVAEPVVVETPAAEPVVVAEPAATSIPAPAVEEKKGGKGLNITAMILGIVGLLTCCCLPVPILSLAALIMGIIGLKKPGKGMAITALILGIIGVVGCVVPLLFGGVAIFGAGGSEMLFEMMEDIFGEAMFDPEMMEGFTASIY